MGGVFVERVQSLSFAGRSSLVAQGEYTEQYGTIHVDMVTLVNFMLHVFHHDKIVIEEEVYRLSTGTSYCT